MQIVLFFSRVAFICNVCFVLTWVMRIYPSLQQNHATSTILILGLLMAVLLNLLTSVAYLVLAAKRTRLPTGFPRWLIIINFLFLIPQLMLIVK